MPKRPVISRQSERFSEDSRQAFIKNAENVYLGYLKLDWMQEWLGKEIEDEDDGAITTLGDLLKRLPDGDKDISLLEAKGGAKQKITLRKNGDAIELISSDFHEVKDKIKDLSTYTLADKANLLHGSRFTYHPGPPGKFSTVIQSSDQRQAYEIGGPGKLDLYKLHISNLGLLIRQFQKDKQSKENMLVSLTTGSGKTFTQALIILTLELADLKGAFGIPHHLITQFRADLNRLLPDAFIEKLDASPNIVIASHEDILTRETILPQDFSAKNTLISFDEAHLIAQQENLFLKAKQFAGKFLSFYSTATPTPALYKIAEGNEKVKHRLHVVATMTNKQKQAQGYARPVQSFDAEAKSIRTMSKKSKVKLATRMKRLAADAIDPERGYNAANAFMESFLYSIPKHDFINKDNLGELRPTATPLDKLRFAAQWNLQLSAFAGKTLVNANYFEDLVNLDELTKKHMEENLLPSSDSQNSAPAGGTAVLPTPTFSKEVYTQKNKEVRDTTYHFMQMTQEIGDKVVYPDIEIFEAYENKIHQDFKTRLQKELSQLSSSLALETTKEEKQQLAEEMMKGLASAPLMNSMHGVIDLTLSVLACGSDLSATRITAISQQYGTDYLDKNRFNQLSNFTQRLVQQAQHLKAGPALEDILKKLLTYDEKNNPRGVDKTTADSLSPIMAGIIRALADTSDVKSQQQLVNNWFADQRIFSTLPNANALYEFAKNHYKRFIFRNVEKNEGLEPGQAFASFQEEEYGIGFGVEQEGKEKKTRPLRAVESLNRHAKEFRYHPHSPEGMNTSQQLNDNLFLLGLTSMYVTDTKVEGFNDPALQQVALLTPHTQNALANPANILQAYGRNRGLNKLRIPHFLLVRGKGVECVFGVDKLNKDKCDINKGLKQFKKHVLKKLGDDLGEKIVEWILKNHNALHEVDEERLAEATFKELFDVLEQVNKENAFHFTLTLKDYRQVLNRARFYLERQQRDKLKGTVLSPFVKFVANLIHFVGRILHFFARRKPNAQLDEVYEGIKNRVQKDKENPDFQRVNMFRTLTKTDLGESWDAIMNFNIINATLFGELRKLPELKNKYLSEMIAKAYQLISPENRSKIKKGYPDLEIAIKGILSLIALSTEENKQTLIKEFYDSFQAENPSDTLLALLKKLNTLTLDPTNPYRDKYLLNINKLFDKLGFGEKGKPRTMEDIQSQLKDDVTKEQDKIKILLFLAPLRPGFDLVQSNPGDQEKYQKRMFNLLANDIQTIVQPYVLNPAYINMLAFIKKHKDKLPIIFKESSNDHSDTLPPNTKGLLAFIDDIMALSKKPENSTFYQDYFIPEEFKSQDMNPEHVSAKAFERNQFFTCNNLISLVFNAFNEVNMIFHHVTPEGQEKSPDETDKRFFKPIDNTLPYVREIIGHQIKIVKKVPADLEPQTLYLVESGTPPYVLVENIIQTDNAGETILEKHISKCTNKEEETVFGELQAMIIDWKKIDCPLKPGERTWNFSPVDDNPNFITYERRQHLNSSIVTLGGKSLFGPSLTDEDNTWRQVKGLNALKRAIPTINSTQYAVTAKELRTSLSVSKRILSRIITNKETYQKNDPLITQASLFNRLLREESLFKTPDLGEARSRVEKMRSQFTEKKEALSSLVLDQEDQAVILSKIDKVIDVLEKTSTRSPLFFRKDASQKQLEIAKKFRDNLAYTYFNCQAMMKLVDKTLAKEASTIPTFFKSSQLHDSLLAIRTLLENQLTMHAASPKKN